MPKLTQVVTLRIMLQKCLGILSIYRYKATLSQLLLLAISLVLLTIFPCFYSEAGSLGASYLYLSRIQANVATGVEYVLAIDTGQAIPSGGTVTLTFPDADDGMWCRTAGTLTVAGVASSAADYATTNWDIDSVLPTSGTLSASCTKGSGSSSVDTIVISNVGALSAGTTYGVKLTNSTGILGTDDTTGNHVITVEARNGTTVDASSFIVYLLTNDTVVVSATVLEIPTITCSLSTNTVDLGTIYPGGSFTTSTMTITTTTSSATSGYYWAAYGQGDGSTDAGLYKSDATTYLIASTGSGTINLGNTNTEGFGMRVSDPDSTYKATVPVDFNDFEATIFGALDRGTAGAQLILSQSRTQPDPESATITFGSRAGLSAIPGSYQEHVTFVCGAYIDTSPSEDTHDGPSLPAPF